MTQREAAEFGVSGASGVERGDAGRSGPRPLPDPSTWMAQRTRSGTALACFGAGRGPCSGERWAWDNGGRVGA
jgi:hypothetical protein